MIICITKTVIFSLTFINFTKRKRFFWTTVKKVKLSNYTTRGIVGIQSQGMQRHTVQSFNKATKYVVHYGLLIDCEYIHSPCTVHLTTTKSILDLWLPHGEVWFVTLENAAVESSGVFYITASNALHCAWMWLINHGNPLHETLYTLFLS